MKPYAFLLVALAASIACGGTVRTLDGKTHSGDIRLDGTDELAIVPRAGAPVRVELSNVMLAQFKTTEPAAPEAAAGKWTSRDVGQPALSGEARMTDKSLVIRSAGKGIGERADQFYYVYQAVTGNTQIVARVTSLQKSDKTAQAGIMIRGGLFEGAPFAAVHVHPDEPPHFLSRTAAGQSATESRNGVGTIPVWIKLVRHGDEFSSYCSNDGRDWKQMGEAKIKMPQAAMVGATTCSHNAGVMCTATFDRPAISVGEDPPEKTGSVFHRGVVLRNGTMISGQIRSADDSVVRIFREREQDRAIPVTEVARVVVSRGRGQGAERIGARTTGVLLANGDFVDGQIRVIQDGGVKVSSVLFGMRRFDLPKVAVVVWRDVVPVPCQYEIRLADGSVLYADKVKSERDALIVEAGAAGVLRFANWEILEIKAGPSRFKSLADLKPAKVEGPLEGGRGWSLVVDGTSAGGAMNLGGQPCERGVGLSAGTSASYKLDGNYRILVGRVGVPGGVLPMGAVRLVLLGDGMEVYRSPELSSLGEPAALSVNLAGIKTLLVKVEGVGQLGGGVLLADPALIK